MNKIQILVTIEWNEKMEKHIQLEGYKDRNGNELNNGSEYYESIFENIMSDNDYDLKTHACGFFSGYQIERVELQRTYTVNE